MSKHKNYYAVKVGRQTGIFTSWEQCKAQVDKYKGALFKGFETKKGAEMFLNGKTKKKPIQQSLELNVSGERLYNFDKYIMIQEAMKRGKGIIAYVDGSFNEKTSTCGYGCILIDNKGELARLYGDCGFIDTSQRNIVGEVTACISAIKYAIEHKYEVINIYYDYMGIEMWTNGSWKTKNKLTKRYKNIVSKASKKIKINFIKVKAHSGNYYNEIADELAKKGCGLL